MVLKIFISGSPGHIAKATFRDVADLARCIDYNYLTQCQQLECELIGGIQHVSIAPKNPAPSLQD